MQAHFEKYTALNKINKQMLAIEEAEHAPPDQIVKRYLAIASTYETLGELPGGGADGNLTGLASIERSAEVYRKALQFVDGLPNADHSTKLSTLKVLDGLAAYKYRWENGASDTEANTLMKRQIELAAALNLPDEIKRAESHHHTLKEQARLRRFRNTYNGHAQINEPKPNMNLDNRWDMKTSRPRADAP